MGRTVNPLASPTGVRIPPYPPNLQVNTKMAVRQPNATCEVCGQAYWVQSTRLAQSRFCSNACKSDHAGGVISKAELTVLYYEQRLSMQQIADRVGCSVNKVVYYMQQYSLERRNLSDATYAYWNVDGERFTIKLPETVEEKELLALAIGLFMGEGTRKSTSSVKLANSNPNIHKVFIRFLTEICGVDRSSLQAGLNIFDDCDVDEAVRWWSNELNISTDKFFRPIVRESRGGNYKNKSVYGTLTITIGNTKLKQIVDNWCDEYYNRFSIIT